MEEWSTGSGGAFGPRAAEAGRLFVRVDSRTLTRFIVPDPPCRAVKRWLSPRWNEKAGTHGPRDAISSQNIRTRSAKETGHEEA
jgi:hypothetical protein